MGNGGALKLAISGSEHVRMTPSESSALNAVSTAQQRGNISVAVGASFVGIEILFFATNKVNQS
jgi:hypothetical protein